MKSAAMNSYGCRICCRGLVAVLLCLHALIPGSFARPILEPAATPAANTTATSARRGALQASKDACEHGHIGYIVELDTARATAAGGGGIDRLEALIDEATKPRARRDGAASAPAAITRRLAAISAVAAELDADAISTLLHQPDVASITADCIVRVAPDELPGAPTSWPP